MPKPDLMDWLLDTTGKVPFPYFQNFKEVALPEGFGDMKDVNLGLNAEEEYKAKRSL